MVVPRRVLPLAALAALVGCGKKDDPKADVRAAVERFGTAVGKQDYQQLCDRLLSGGLVAQVEEHGLPCEVALKTGFGEARQPRLQIRTVQVNGDKALVGVHSTAANQPPSDDTLELVREHGAWRVSALAKPEPQPPATTTSP